MLERHVPRYYFHHRDGGAFNDETGEELPDDEAARREAMIALPEMARDMLHRNGDKQGYVIMVTDESGKPVYSATLNFAGVWLRT